MLPTAIPMTAPKQAMTPRCSSNMTITSEEKHAGNRGWVKGLKKALKHSDGDMEMLVVRNKINKES